MDDFIETPRIEEEISYGSKGGPGFKTSVFASESGFEGRSQNWTYSRGRWEISKSIRDTLDMDVVRALYYNAYGRARGFRFKDWSDYQMTRGVIGTGDGTTQLFKIKKLYGTGSYQYTRRLFKPVTGTVSVYVNNVLKLSSTYTLSTTLGTITFDALNIPALGHVVDVTCEFDVPVRFDTDEMQASAEIHDIQSWGNIPIIEILIDE